MKKRIFLKTALVLGATAFAPPLSAFSWQTGPFSLPKLAFAPDALEPHIDRQTMEIHHGKHHQAYVDNLNKAVAGTTLAHTKIEDILRNASKHPAIVRNNAGGHYNHTLFWTLLSGKGGGQPSGRLATAIMQTFGSFDQFKEQFSKAATGQFGSGWAWLNVENDKKLMISSTPNQDNPLMDVAEKRGTPILGLDIWEHAYYMKYQNRRADYINAFWNVVNWPEVEKNYAKVMA